MRRIIFKLFWLVFGLCALAFAVFWPGLSPVWAVLVIFFILIGLVC